MVDFYKDSKPWRHYNWTKNVTISWWKVSLNIYIVATHVLSHVLNIPLLILLEKKPIRSTASKPIYPFSKLCLSQTRQKANCARKENWPWDDFSVSRSKLQCEVTKRICVDNNHSFVCFGTIYKRATSLFV